MRETFWKLDYEFFGNSNESPFPPKSVRTFKASSKFTTPSTLILPACFLAFSREFLDFCNSLNYLKRDLKDHQKKSFYHLYNSHCAANFSVPGSGKTTITYAALSKWMDDGIINKILVIGPTPSFFPWEDEYRECFGLEIDSQQVSGDIANVLPSLDNKLILMHFATAMNKTQQVIEYMNKEKNVTIYDLFLFTIICVLSTIPLIILIICISNTIFIQTCRPLTRGRSRKLIWT